MSAEVAADRSRLLRSKKAEISGIVTSRKRKLREFFAVCDNEGPIPQINLTNIDAPPTTQAEKKFLEVSDILQNRLFDESNLPTRRQLRSSTAKQRSPIRKGSPEIRTIDASRKAARLQRDGSNSRRSRTNSPSSRNDGVPSTTAVEGGQDASAGRGVPMQRSTSKGSQTDLSAEAAATLDEIVEETFEHLTRERPSISDNVVLAKELEIDRMRTRVEIPPNSPGADPRMVLPVSAEDSSELPEPLVEGLSSHGVPHKAATVHLPPQEVQEAHLRENKKARQQRNGQGASLSINLPPRDGGRPAEPLSSPGSTNGANSATTPALHEASTDTSPDNDSNRYDADRLEKDDDAETPPELKPTVEEDAEKEEHDRIQRAQIEVSRREILGSSPTDADDQLRLEEEAASFIDPAVDDHQVVEGEQEDSADATEVQETSDQLTKAADEVVQDVVDDQDRVDAVTIPEDEPMSGIETSNAEPTAPESKSDQREVADSEAEDQTPPVDAMDVDATTVKDSFESSAALESRVGTSPVEATVASPEKLADHSKKSSATPSSTPRRTPSTPAAAPPTLERMTTRVSSGAMRHKSVSEILGEIPRPNTTSSSERSLAKVATDSESAGNSNYPSRSGTPQSPSTRVRSLVEKAKDKERSKLSTVIFPGPGRAPAKSTSNDTALMPSGSQPSQAAKEDYFMPLFVATTSADKRGVPSLDDLISTAHKTITTSNAYVPILENQTVKILKRIYNLQHSHKWSLRQHKRSPEPIRPTTHWDVLLQEAKWMRTDFREERKWKTAVARNLAFACAEWVSASSEDRQLLQAKARPPQRPDLTSEASKDEDIGEPFNRPFSDATPELVASGEFDSHMEDFDEEPRLDLLETVSPTAIFALQDDDVVFGLRRSPTSDKLLNELPLYGAPLTIPQSELPTSELDPDRLWRKPALPLSKYVEGRMELKLEEPPRKKSRFEYEDEDDDDDLVVFGGEPGAKRPILPPEQTDVALFNPEHKHIRDRIHSSHQFRPPSEFPMPLQSFFECRTASQWTWDEDNDLKKHVQDYSYNWSLISSMLSSKSLFASGAERRTPWECFERWIHMEGLPTDMQKTHYFRAYTSRIDQANRNVMAQAAQIQQQPNINGQIQPPPRRRTTASVRVERRRNQKHLTLVDAMRKLAKKRETSLQKQQHAAGLAAMRKANEVTQARGVVHTPQDFSRLKHEREEQMKERLIQLQQRQEAQRRAVLLQQRNAAQNPQQASLPNANANGGPQQPRLPPANGSLAPNGTSSSSGQNLTVPGQNQNRPRPMPPQMPSSSMQNGLRVPQMPPMNGVPSVPMHGIQGQLPLPNPALDVGLVARAQNISEQQRQAIRMQQQGQLPGQSPQMHNSPPRMNGMPQPGFQMPNMMPPFNSNTNGVGTPPSNNMIPSPGQGQGHAGSPRMGQSHNGGNISHVKIMEQNLQSKYPSATPEQVTRMIQEHLSKSVHQQQQRQGLAQSAMNAAAGAGGNGMAGVNPGQGTPQLYAQMLRQQQENQQKAAQAQQQAANAVGNGQSQQGQINGQVNGTGNGLQGHAHRGSSGSVQSGK